MFGYLMVTRLNTCQGRYWEGVGLAKMMWSKWADACLQLVTFNTAVDAVDVEGDPFNQVRCEKLASPPWTQAV